MFISIDWINEFVKLPAMSAQELGSKFTLATAEVEDVKEVGSHFEKVHVAKILAIRNHPDSDHMHLVTLELDQAGTQLEIVCGAQNIRLNQKICFAPNGTTLPNGMTLAPRVIRGVRSEGMICSEEELGLAESSEGIIELPDDAPVGMNLVDYMHYKKDVLLEIDNKSITHRPDLWGHYGMAREFSTIFESPLATPFDETWKKNLEAKFTTEASPIKPVVDLNGACVAYFGLSVNGIKVGESPDWIKSRLVSCGMRPLNSIVDISNYVMLELGIPNHIFDRKKISGNELFIKPVGENKTFKTLDGVERALIPTDTVIADSVQPLVIGGVMGGENCSVDESTTEVFIECANFKPANIRKTSTRLGLRTDSSLRYEKTLDSKLLERTMLRILDLLLQLNPGATVVGKPEYSGVDLSTIKDVVINTSVSKIENVLGLQVGEERIVKILTSLDFKVADNNGDLTITVPSYRATKDVSCQDDIVEEIGRIVGFDNIVPVAPRDQVAPVSLSTAKAMERKIRTFLSTFGHAYEVMTYPMIGEKTLSNVQWPCDSDLKLLNAISEEADRMRPSLIPSLLQVAQLNAKNYAQFKFFELGRSYHGDKKNFSVEENNLVLCSFHKSKNTFLETQDTVECLLNALSVPHDFCEKNPKFKNPLVPEEWIGVHPYEFANIRIMGRMQGAVVSVHPILLKKLKIKGNLTIAVINLSAFENMKVKSKVKYQPLPKFPKAEFDCTVVMPKDTAALKALDALKNVHMKELVDRKILDIFPLEDGTKAVTVRTTFFDPEKTLEAGMIKAGEDAVIAALAKAGYELRK